MSVCVCVCVCVCVWKLCLYDAFFYHEKGENQVLEMGIITFIGGYYIIRSRGNTVKHLRSLDFSC